MFAYAGAIASMAGDLAAAAVDGVTAMPAWAVLVTMLGLFAAGGYVGLRDRKEHGSPDTFDVR
jgi:hypothetical protein